MIPLIEIICLTSVGAFAGFALGQSLNFVLRARP